MKSILSLALVVAAGCSGGGKKVTVKPDASSGVDGNTTPDAPSGGCVLAASLGSPTSTQIDGSYDDPAAPTDVILTGDLNADAMPDLIQLEFYKGTTGAFMGGLAPKMITLAGDELSYATCGACIFAYDTADADQTSVYFATGGTLDLTSISTTYGAGVTSKVEGTLSNVTFAHVNVDFGGTNVNTPAADGCTSTLASYTFSTTMFTAAMFAGRDTVRVPLHRKH